MIALVRPEAVTLASDSTGESGPLTGTVIASTFLGATSRVTVDLGDTTILAQLTTADATELPGGQPGRADDPAGSGAGVRRRGRGRVSRSGRAEDPA